MGVGDPSPGTSGSMVVKDVQAELLLEKKSRRKPGQVVYPLEYSSEMMDFDNWDYMFLKSFCRGITMHQFTTPPSVVLDLGCGGGLWVIEAATQWKDSTVIGFDMAEFQPSKAVLDKYTDLGRRVQWVHGSLLDGLPFASNYFDFVRMAGMGLGVPEDEWQFVLEEIARVLKPGCPFEIIEEDLIFPCSRPPDLLRLPSSAGGSPYSPLTSSSSVPLAGTSSSSLTSRAYGTPMSSLTFISEDWTSTSSRDAEKSSFKATSSFSDRPLLQSSSSDHHHYTEPPSPPPAQISDNSHFRLKAAWEAMLASRFLPSQLLTVLPFYLSSVFTDIQSHPPLHIPLPPNSYSSTWPNGRESIDPDIYFNVKPCSGRSCAEVDENSLFYSAKTSHRMVPLWAPMHLAKTVRTISACKESIWVEYDKLYGDDPSLPSISKTSRPKEGKEDKKKDARDHFENAWLNWRHDMTDRIGARDMVQSEFLWKIYAGDRPDWRIWRDHQVTIDLSGISRSYSKARELCRSLRGFVCWKPS